MRDCRYRVFKDFICKPQIKGSGSGFGINLSRILKISECLLIVSFPEFFHALIKRTLCTCNPCKKHNDKKENIYMPLKRIDIFHDLLQLKN